MRPVKVKVNDRDLIMVGDTAMMDDIVVRVLAVQVQPGPRIVYHVAWYAEGRHDELVEECELKAT